MYFLTVIGYLYFSQSYCAPISLSSVCLTRMRATVLVHRTKSVELSEKWKYFHGFLTFTDGEYTCEMQVMHSGKAHIAQTARLCQGTRSLSVRAALYSKIYHCTSFINI